MVIPSILHYIISSVIHTFWLVLTYDLLEDRRLNDVIVKNFFSVYFNSLLYETNWFQVDIRLISNRSQRTSKCGRNIGDTLGCASWATFLFLPHFDVICDLLLNRCTATWNLFVKYNVRENQSKCLGISAYFKNSHLTVTSSTEMCFTKIHLGFL